MYTCALYCRHLAQPGRQGRQAGLLSCCFREQATSSQPTHTPTAAPSSAVYRNYVHTVLLLSNAAAFVCIRRHHLMAYTHICINLRTSSRTTYTQTHIRACTYTHTPTDTGAYLHDNNLVSSIKLCFCVYARGARGAFALYLCLPAHK